MQFDMGMIDDGFNYLRGNFVSDAFSIIINTTKDLIAASMTC
jgi:hypothetical protein